MRIKKILRQHRRDFTAVFECEHCGAEVTKTGYDDENFHLNVVPDMECGACKKKAGEDYRPLMPKYPDGMQV